MSEIGPAPRPWTAERDDAEDGSIYYAIHAANYEFITNVENKKLAALIVRAVNSLDALVEALQDSLAGLEYIRLVHGDLSGVGWDRAISAASRALSLASGEAL